MDRIGQQLQSMLASSWTELTLLQLGGNLSMLPLELVFNILDELFLGTGHAGLCALRNLSLASRSCFQTVSTYLQSKIPSEYLYSAQWSPFPDDDDSDSDTEIIEIDPNPEASTDLITRTIVDDCPQCFEWLCREFPGLNCESCNQDGWSIAAIAVHAGSARLLKHFLTTTNGAYGSFFPLLGCEANPSALILDTPYRILVDQRDLAKFERCLNVLEPVLFEANTLYPEFEGNIGRSMFNPEDRLTLCTFASIPVGQRLAALGAPLYNIRGTGSSWHAAVLNGPEFLSYIKAHTRERPTSRDIDGDTPLHVAIRSNKVESVIWLSKYTAAHDFSWDSAYPETLEVACQLTSPESVRCLEIILPKYPYWKMDTYTASFYLRVIAEAARESAWTEGVRSDMDQIAYQEIRDAFEDRAIRKTELIVQNSTMYVFFEDWENVNQRQSIRQTQEYRLLRQVRLRAWFGGFDRLASAMKWFLDG